MRVFISHAAADKAFAAQLADQLRKAKFEPWLDANDLRPGENIGLAVGRALDRADAMIVLLSPEAVRSHWVMREIDYGLTERRFAGGRLVPVMVRPTKDVPWILRELNFIDATRDSGAGKRVVDALKEARS